MPAVINPAAGNSIAAPTDVNIINDNISKLAVMPRQRRRRSPFRAARTERLPKFQMRTNTSLVVFLY